MLARVLLKLIKVLVLTYPVLYKETISKALRWVDLKLVVNDLMQVEVDHYWIIHPPSTSSYTSPLITEVTKTFLASVDECILNKLFLRRQTRLILIKEVCFNETIARAEGKLLEVLAKQVSYYPAEFKIFCRCQSQEVGGDHLCPSDLIKQMLS